MSETTHTPGPWKFYYGSRSIYNDDDTVSVAVISGPYTRHDDRVKANGRLIAAAPDLYSALSKAREWMEERREIAECVPELADAITALAKARGESA